MKKGRYMQVIAVLAALLLYGCGMQKVSETKVRDIEYTVVSEDKLPEELKVLIDGKREQPFKMTYQDAGYLYICEGYGGQPTGGYSIQVKEVYESENAIYFLSTLLGPTEKEAGSETPSYPYIVIKTEYQDMTVVFD